MALDTWTYEATLPSVTTGVESVGGSPAAAAALAEVEVPCELLRLLRRRRRRDDGSELLLLFLGLDTVADVRVNGSLVLQARNFHRCSKTRNRGAA